MRKVWVISKREYITRVRTKGFVIATISIPLLTAGVFGLSVLLATRQRSHTLKIATLDEAGGLSAAIARGLTRNLPDGQPLFRVVKTIEQPEAEEKARARLRAEVVAGGLDGYLVVPKDVTAGKAAEFHTRNPGDFMLMGSIESAVSDAVIARRLEERSEEHTSELQSRLHLVCRLLLEKKKKKTNLSKQQQVSEMMRQ